MKKIFILTLIFLTVLSGCGVSNYDKYMRNGKDALKEENYDEAMKQFDLALIEEPTNKDAIALKQRTEESVRARDYHKQIDRFLSDTTVIYEELKSIGADYDTMLNNITVDRANGDIQKLDKLEDRFEAISTRWVSDPSFSNAYNSLYESFSGIQGAAVAISENIVDTNLTGKSRFEVFRSDDSKVRARISLTDYKYGLQKYDKDINDFKTELHKP